jgi:SAM-dependent methyltransferase
MSIESIRKLVADLSTSATALAVLGGELHARVSGKNLDPGLRPHVEAVLQELGVSSALEGVAAEDLRPLVALIRHSWLLNSEFLLHPERIPGWTYTDPEVLITGGQVAEGFVDVLARMVPQFDNLAARLSSPDACLLDIGTGVGLLSIAMAHRWPELRVVGIDPWAPALKLARTNVTAAGLEDRIELREQSGEEITDEQTFDLVWLPALYMPPDVLQRIVGRVHRALKPGGWLVLGTQTPDTGLRGALTRFGVAAWGGYPMSQEEIENQLAGAGFAQRRVLPGSPQVMIVAARRAPNL